MKFLFFALQLLLFTNIAQAQVEKYTVRNEDLGLEFEFPEEVIMNRKIIDRLDASSWVEVIGEGNVDAVATHLLEVVPAMSLSNKKDISFVDSTQTLKVVYQYVSSGQIDMLVTDVKSGNLSNTLTYHNDGIAAIEHLLKYKDVGWAPKMSYSGDNKKFLDAKLDKLYEKEFPVLERDARKRMVDLVTNYYPAYFLFPFRLKVIEAAEIDEDEVEKVIINGGANVDLGKRDRLVVYRIKEQIVGKKKYEHFETIGRLKYEKDDAKGGYCDVLRGKKDILAALKAGETIYCVPGFKPYTKKDKGNDVKVAIMINYPPNVDEKDKSAFYRRARLDLSKYKGIKIIERELISKIESERALQKQEKFIDVNTVAQFKSLGADMILEIDLKGKVDKYNEKNLTSVLNLIDVETNTIEGTKTTPNYGSASLKFLNVNPYSFVKGILPSPITVLEMTDFNDKKQTADEVLIAGDFTRSEVSLKLDVYRRRMIDVEGEMLPRYEKIGTVALREDEGEGVVNCKVKNGEKEIYAAMKAGELLVCSSKAGIFERITTNSFKSLSKLYGM
jgi:hypothetical protein